ncbi:MAG: hypothetical protein KAI47_15025 [Deltaproteobacteria bacterium]|nr:hypothetical protein [Deltaproteobacteria bacterium]
MRRISRYSIISLTLALAGLIALTSCSDDTTRPRPKETGPIADGPISDGPVTTKTLRFVRKEVLDPQKAGRYAWIAKTAGKLGVAYFRVESKEKDQPCPPSGTAQKRPVSEIYYVAYDGTNWGTPSLVAEVVGPTFGLSLTFDGSNNPNVGHLGGALSLTECSSSDAVRSVSTDGGKTFTEQMINSGVAPGDTAGHWTNLARDPSGAIQSVYRDVQFGHYTKDGDARADLRYGPSGEGIAEGDGDGVYAALLFKQDGTPVVSATNFIDETVSNRGLKVFWKEGDTWETKKVYNGAVGERPGFGTNDQGLFALAYYTTRDESLQYVESPDLKTWTAPKLVDFSTTDHGTFASIAFDSHGNPGISYYRCGKSGSSAQGCDPVQDALMFAYRQNGHWKTYEVDTGGANFCGRYTSLVFDEGDHPVIAYQCVTLDNKTNTFPDTLKVAHGVWK